MIAAEGEQKASKSLREASEIIAQSPSALQLRYLQVRILRPYHIKHGMPLVLYYRVTHHVVLLVPLTSIQKLHFSIRSKY